MLHTDAVTLFLQSMYPYPPGQCLEHPLGILCRCAEYSRIVDKFEPYTVSTQHPLKPKFNVEPIASAAVVWVPMRSEMGGNPTLPLLYYCKIEREKVDERNVKKRWIPVNTELVSPKEIRPNTCYLHETERHTQSAELSTLTDMLPHRGRVIRRRDVEWGIGSHTTPVQMSDELETKWPKINGCFSIWADAFTVSMSCPPF